MADEPHPRWYHFSAAVHSELQLIYGGRLNRGESEPPTTVYFCSNNSEEWRQATTTEGTHPPPNLYYGGCTSIEEYIFLQGGWDGEQFYNTLYQLDCRDLKWTQLSSAGDQGAPIAKYGHGMVHHGPSVCLLVFGGRGLRPTGPTQPGAEYEVEYNYVYTNELHIFNLRKGQWSSPAVTGRRPPPCADFTLTMVDDHRAVLFGGYNYSNRYLDHLYVLDIAGMHWSQVDDDKGPEGREKHAAVCLGFGGDHPQLLITGGYAPSRTLGDAWTLDLRSWRWREVYNYSLKGRYGHSTTAFTLSQEITEVIMFGGVDDHGNGLSDTTVLRFKWLEQPTRDGPPTKEWVLTDTATGSQLGTEQRVRKKEEINTSSGEKEFLKAINSLLAKGDNISRKLAHCVISGPTGSGKSSLLKRLLQKHLEKFSKSTGIIESMVFVDMNEINPTTFHSATAVDFDLWKEVDYDVSLVSQIGQSTTTTTPSSTQIPADSKPTASAPLPDVIVPKKEEKKRFEFLQIFKRNRKSTSSAAPLSYQVTKKGAVSVVAISSDAIFQVIRRHGFEAFKEYLKKTSSLYLRDTGGQVEFQEMLPLLIFGPSIFLFVFRADLDFQSKLSFQYRESEGRSLNCYTSSITTEEALLQFLASVYAMDTSGKDVIKTHKSLVFIVGTHIDKLGSSAVERLEQLNQHINSVIIKNGFHDLVQYADEHKGDVIFPVDNTSDSDQNFSGIRTKVNSVVSHREEFTIEYPTSFLLFCLDLQNVKKAILSLDEFKVLATRHGIKGQQVFTLLYFLHLRVGVVRYFNVDGLRDIVVLQPQVLFNTITALIVKTFSCEAVLSREKSEYKEKGMLSATAFESVISIESRPHILSFSSEEEMKKGIVPASAFGTITVDGDLPPKKFLLLLVQLRIIAPFPTAENQEEKYFIPCVLNHVPESTQEDLPHTDVLPLAVKFQCQHCPKGIFGVLVTHLMTPDSGKREVTFSLMQNKIFKDQVFFTVHSTGGQDTISLTVFSSHLEIKFFPDSLQNRSSPIGRACQSIREAISISIDKSLVDLHYSKERLEPFMCLRCESCTELHPVFEGGEFHKIHCTKTLKSSLLPAQGRCWYNEGEPSPGVGSTGSVTEASGHSHQPEMDHGHNGAGASGRVSSHSPQSGHSGAGASGGVSSHLPQSGHSGRHSGLGAFSRVSSHPPQSGHSGAGASGGVSSHLPQSGHSGRHSGPGAFSRVTSHLPQSGHSGGGTSGGVSSHPPQSGHSGPGAFGRVTSHPPQSGHSGPGAFGRVTSHPPQSGHSGRHSGPGAFSRVTSHLPQSGHSGGGTSGGVSSHPPQSGHSGPGAFGRVTSHPPQSGHSGPGAFGRVTSHPPQSGHSGRHSGPGAFSRVTSHLPQSGHSGGGTSGGVSSHPSQSGHSGGGMSGGVSSHLPQSGHSGGGTSGGVSSHPSQSGHSGGGTSGGVSSHPPQSRHSGGGTSGGVSSHPPQSGHSGPGTSGGVTSHLPQSGHSGGQPFASSYAAAQPFAHPTGQYLQPLTTWQPTPSVCPTGQPWPSAGPQLSLPPHQVPGYHPFYTTPYGYRPSAPPLQDTFWTHPSVGAVQESSSDTGAANSEFNHAKVVKYLKDLSNQEITNIGVRLGLHYARLKRMSCESLMDDMVLALLRKDDDVGEISGDPSWQTLCTALKECGHTGIVSTIQRNETLRDLV